MEEALKLKCDLLAGERARSRKKQRKDVLTRKTEKRVMIKRILFSEQEESCTPELPHSVKNMWKICPLVRPLLATE